MAKGKGGNGNGNGNGGGNGGGGRSFAAAVNNVGPVLSRNEAQQIAQDTGRTVAQVFARAQNTGIGIGSGAVNAFNNGKLGPNSRNLVGFGGLSAAPGYNQGTARALAALAPLANLQLGKGTAYYGASQYNNPAVSTNSPQSGSSYTPASTTYNPIVLPRGATAAGAGGYGGGGAGGAGGGVGRGGTAASAQANAWQNNPILKLASGQDRDPGYAQLLTGLNKIGAFDGAAWARAQAAGYSDQEIRDALEGFRGSTNAGLSSLMIGTRPMAVLDNWATENPEAYRAFANGGAIQFSSPGRVLFNPMGERNIGIGRGGLQDRGITWYSTQGNQNEDYSKAPFDANLARNILENGAYMQTGEGMRRVMDGESPVPTRYIGNALGIPDQYGGIAYGYDKFTSNAANQFAQNLNYQANFGNAVAGGRNRGGGRNGEGFAGRNGGGRGGAGGNVRNDGSIESINQLYAQQMDEARAEMQNYAQMQAQQINAMQMDFGNQISEITSAADQRVSGLTDLMMFQQMQSQQTQSLLQQQAQAADAAYQEQARQAAALSTAFVPAPEASAGSLAYGDQRDKKTVTDPNSLSSLAIISGLGTNSNPLAGLQLA